jgi:hypothetical protein
MTYFENLMSSDISDDIDQLSTRLTATTGRRWDLQGSDRGIGFIVGAKANPLGAGQVRPYIGGGVGALNLRRRITDRVAGDVTDATLTEFGIGDFEFTSNKITRPMARWRLG